MLLEYFLDAFTRNIPQIRLPKHLSHFSNYAFN